MAVLQININHSLPALDLALATAGRLEARIVVISEPYLFNGTAFPSTPGWQRVFCHGAAILIENSLPFTRVEVNSHNTVAVDIGDVRLIGTYLSPNVDPEDEFVTLHNLLLTNRRVVLAGDFNCHHPDLYFGTFRRRDRVFNQLLLDHALLTANSTHPTREQLGVESILDYTLYRAVPLSNWQVRGDLESLSDHKYITYSMGTSLPPRRTIKKTDMVQAEELLAGMEIPSLELTNGSDCNTFATTLTAALSNIIDSCTVATEIRTRSVWWTDELECVHRSLKKLRRRHRSTADNSTRLIIRAMRLDLCRLIRDAKRKSFREFVSSSVPWGRPYKLIVRNPSRTTQMLPDETLLHEKIGRKPANAEVAAEPSASIELEDDSFCVQPAEVTKYLKKSRNRSAPGPDGINFKLLKAFHRLFPAILPALFSACLQHGVFPDIWKRGRIVWIPKEGKDPASIDGYRPITLLSALGKTYEKCVASRMWDFIQQQNILSARQFGFVPKKSTERSIQSLLSDVQHIRSNYRHAAILLVDIKAAFDSLNWSHLLGELDRYKFPLYLIHTIRSYLLGRIVSSGSAAVMLEKGCPQGSVLGPLLWNLSFNYILQHFEGRQSINCYADDTAFAFGAQSDLQLVKKVKRTFQELSTLLERAGLSLNVPKTELLRLGRSQGGALPKPVKFKLAGHTIRTCPVVKYLGVYLDSKLCFKDHISNMCEKARKTFGKLSVVCANTFGYSNAARRIMLDGTIGAYFRYAASVYAHCLVNNRSRKAIESLHRLMVINCGRLYRTVSYYPATAITNYTPLDLTIAAEAIERALMEGWPLTGTYPLEIPEAGSRRAIRSHLLTQIRSKWQQRYDSCGHGEWTRHLLPNIGMEIAGLDFHLAQALSGHGAFREYLHRFKRCDSPLCECGSPETPRHVFIECARHASGRPTPLNLRSQEGVQYLERTMRSLWDAEVVRKRRLL